MPVSEPTETQRGPAARLAGACLAAALLAVAGCAQQAAIQPAGGAGTGTDAKGQPMPAQYPDVPIPKGAKRNVDRTVVVGTKTWFGQLSLDTTYSADSMYNFYTRELSNYGWRKITAVRAPISVLTYDREDRVLTIAIQPNRIRGSEVTVTVSPREDAAPEPAPPPALPAPARPAPIQSQPLPQPR